MPSDHTQQLLQQAHAGDPAALEALVRDHLDWITAHVRARLGDKLRRKEQTADLVQSTMREFLQYGPRFELENAAHLRALLAAIAENVVRGRHEWFTRKRRDMHREATAAGQSRDPLERAAHSEASPSNVAGNAEERDHLRLAIELLDPLDREVVLRREFDGEPYTVIGVAVGMSEDGARKRFDRAVGKLSGLIAELRAGRLKEVVTAGAPRHHST